MNNSGYWIACIFKRKGITCTYCRVNTCMDCFLYKHPQEFKNTSAEIHSPRLKVWKTLFLACESDHE